MINSLTWIQIAGYGRCARCVAMGTHSAPRLRSGRYRFIVPCSSCSGARSPRTCNSTTSVTPLIRPAQVVNHALTALASTRGTWSRLPAKPTCSAVPLPWQRGIPSRRIAQRIIPMTRPTPTYIRACVTAESAIGRRVENGNARNVSGKLANNPEPMARRGT